MANREAYINVFKFAMQMEKEGHDFFLDASKKFEDPVTVNLFESLAEVELSHYDYLERELEKYKEADKDYKMDETFLEEEGTTSIFEKRAGQANLNTALKESDVPDVTILRMAYLIERDFAEFYEDARDAIEDPELKKVFDQLAKWEYTHEELFKTEYKRLRQEYMNLPWGG